MIEHANPIGSLGSGAVKGRYEPKPDVPLISRLPPEQQAEVLNAVWEMIFGKVEKR